MKIVTIGQAPSSRAGHDRPLSGRSSRRLAELMGVSADEMMDILRPVNLLDYFPGKAGKGDRFPMSEAREAARAFSFGDATSVILLGRGVGKAFGVAFDYLQIFRLENRLWATILPHPSGVNRWYNDPKNRQRIGWFLRGKRDEVLKARAATRTVP